MKIFFCLYVTILIVLYGFSSANAEENESVISNKLLFEVQKTNHINEIIQVANSNRCLDYDCLDRCRDNCNSEEDNYAYNRCLDQCEGFCTGPCK